MHLDPNDSSTDPRKRVRVAPGCFLRGGRYSVSYTDDEGVHRHKTTEARNITEAKALRERLRVDVRAGTAVNPSRVTFAQVAEEFFEMFESLVKAGERSEATLDLYRQRYRKHLEKRLGRLPVQSIRAEHIARMLRELRASGLSTWTIQSVLTLAGNLLNHAVTRGLIAETPLKRLSKTERPRVRNKTKARILTREETALLIAATPGPYRALIATTAVTGARQSEALGLTWKCVDFEASTIRFRHQLSRAKKDSPARLIPLKSGESERDVEMIPALAKLLAQHKLLSPFASPEDFVFTTATGKPMYYRNVSARGLEEGAERAGLNADSALPRLSFHDLRHSAISHLIRSGADVVRVQRFAGHSKPSTTLDCYSHEFRAREGDDIGQRLAVAFEGVL